MIANDILTPISKINSQIGRHVLDAEIEVFLIDDQFLDEEYVFFKAKDIILGGIKSDLIKYIKSQISSLFLYSMLENIQEAIIAVDKDGKIFYANKSYTRVLGVPIKNVIGRNMKEVEKEATIIKVLYEHKPINRQSNYIKSINKFVDVRINPLFRKGEFVGAYSIFKDVTLINDLNEEVDRVSKLAEEYNRQLFVQKKMKELNIIGKSPNYLRVISKAISVSKTDASVLILGENGTGKDVLSQLIYKNSSRSDKPFVVMNCAAVPENLIESEMFGYEEGAFTGAQKGGKLGKFELADKGSIFLDEIADMSLAMQSKLLRVLETGEIEKVGSQKKIKVDVRVIAATNKDIDKLIQTGDFREDLYYRLSVITLVLPPLRERDHDKTLFLNYFLNYYNDKYGKNVSFSKNIAEILENYNWPGNIRELKNCIEHAVILTDSKYILTEHLPLKIQKTTDEELGMSLEDSLDKFEKKQIEDAVLRYDSDLEKVAEYLQVSTRTLYRKIKKHKILTKLT